MIMNVLLQDEWGEYVDNSKSDRFWKYYFSCEILYTPKYIINRD